MKKPNVILITADQLRVHEVGCYGGVSSFEKPITPNIDAFAENGIRFDLTFTTNPVCTPARSSIISGQYGRSCIGTVFNANEPSEDRIVFHVKTLPELLKDEGYATSIIGKWHMHVAPKTLGFDEYAFARVNQLHRDEIYDINGRKHLIEEPGSDFEFNRIQDFINRKHDRPFFLFYNYNCPHPPYFDIGDEFLYRYKNGEVPLRANVEAGKFHHFNEEDWFKVYLYDFLSYKNEDPRHNKLPDNFNINDLYAMYKGMINATDHQVGRVIEFIKSAGILEDTIVVFASDHGDNMGSHGLYNKDCSYEESVRVPLIISQHGRFKPSEALDDVVSLIDVAPTILDMCGVGIPKHMQGISLMPLVEQNGTLKRDRVFIECENGEIVCRTKKYKLSVLTEFYMDKTGQGEIKEKTHKFFNMETDPYEIHSNGPDCPDEIMEEIYKSILRWVDYTPWAEPTKPLNQLTW